MGRETLRNAGCHRKTGEEDRLESLMETHLGGLVLDVATGTGSFIGFLRYYAGNEATIVAAEPSPDAVRSVAESFREQSVLPVRADGEYLCFPREMFDAVAVSNSVHHFARPDRVLGDMIRVLKPGGLFVLREMFRDGDQTESQKTHILLHHWRADVDALHGVFHHHTLTRRELEAVPGKLGLTGVLSAVQTDMEADPKSPDRIESVEKTIQSTIARAEGHPELQARGGRIRERLQIHGFSGASSVLLAGIRA